MAFYQKAGAVVSAAVLGWSTAAEATNGDQMLGVTATQWGMAGAVTAAPQDAGTVLTNPAGLAELDISEFRSDMGFGFLNPPREANGSSSDANLYLIPAGALAYRVNERLTLGMGMAGLSGMGVDFDDVMPVPGMQNVVTTKQFYKIAPGFGFRVNDRLSVGAALNIDYQSLAMDLSNPMMTLHLPQDQVYGFGASFGAIYHPNDRLRLGVSYISRQEMEEFDWNTSAGNYRMDMDAPAQLAAGVAFLPGNGLLVEADVKWIGFSDVLDEVDLKQDDGTVMPLQFGWDDQIVYAIGVQKQLNPKTTVRIGYNYGESPIGSEDVSSNIGSLAVTEHHLSFGVTRQLAQRMSASASFVHAFKNEIDSDDGMNTIELEQNVFNVQISYRN